VDFYPLPGKAQGTLLDLSSFASQLDYDKDFKGQSKGDRRFRRAYAGKQYVAIAAGSALFAFALP
jgi:hypothetical protein